MDASVAIGVVLPTRGLIFSEVEEWLEVQREKFYLDVYHSWQIKLPDSQNVLTDKAFENNTLTHILYLEEDVVPPLDGLEKLVAAKVPIACIDYGVQGYPCIARDRVTNEILWCGLGCTLVEKQVFTKLEKPYFRSDKTLRLNDWTWQDTPAKYGGQDIWFGVKAREAGYTITQIEGECDHLKLDSLGIPQVNSGLHYISKKPLITKQNIVDKGGVE